MTFNDLLRSHHLLVAENSFLTLKVSIFSLSSFPSTLSNVLFSLLGRKAVLKIIYQGCPFTWSPLLSQVKILPYSKVWLQCRLFTKALLIQRTNRDVSPLPNSQSHPLIVLMTLFIVESYSKSLENFSHIWDYKSLWYENLVLVILVSPFGLAHVFT